MGLRLFRRWHRGLAPVGRHVRVLPVVTVPGAAATIVGSASLDPFVTGAGIPRAAPVGTPAVHLVFADGESVELDQDDPRVRTFRTAAAALIDPSSA